MTAPRKNPDLVNAPVLFRLPNLHPLQDQRAQQQQHTADPWAMPGQPNMPARPQPMNSAAAAYRNAPAEAPYGYSAPDTRVATVQPATSESDIFAKRPVILLAMALVAGGGWFVGRQTAHHPIAQSQLEIEIAGLTPGAASSQHDLSGAMTAAVRSQPTDSAARASATDRLRASKTSAPEATGQDPNDFYLDDDALQASQSAPLATIAASSGPPRQSAAAVATPETVPAFAEASGANDLASVFAAISLDALSAPANQPSPAGAAAETPPTQPAELTAQKPAATDAQMVAKKAADVPADAAPTAVAQGEAEAGSAVTSDSPTPRQRRVLSPTPNDVPDWSRYFIGGAAPVRSASAEGFIDQSAIAPTSRQAFYQDNAAGF